MDSKDSFRITVEFLEQYGIPMTEDNVDHLDVLMEAMSLYNERTASYGQIWKQYGATGNLLHAALKTDRMMELWWHGGPKPALHKDNLDDAIDALNYLTFFIRNARDANLTGSAPERPRDPRDIDYGPQFGEEDDS
jgi:hypothetical protein